MDVGLTQANPDTPDRIIALAEKTGLNMLSELTFTREQGFDMDLRAHMIDVDGLREIQSYRPTEKGLRAIPTPVGDRVQELCDDLEEFVTEIYGGDPEIAPTKNEKVKARKERSKKAPKNTWAHECPIAKKKVNTKKGSICEHCAAEGE